MTTPTTTIQAAIDSMYITVYNKAADNAGYTYWLTQLPAGTTLGSPATQATFAALANAFVNPPAGSGGSAYWAATYPLGLTNAQFVAQLYQNLGGPGYEGDPAGQAAWTAYLNGGATKATMVGQFVYDFLTFTASSPGAAGLSPAQLHDQQVATQTLWNKVAVSDSYAAASSTTAGASLNAQTSSPTDQGFVAGTDILLSVDSTSASVVAAQALVTSALASSNPTQTIITGSAVLSQQHLTLTTGIDSPTQGFTTGHGATATVANSSFIAAPVAGTLGLNNTLNTGDDLEATGAAAGTTTLNFTAVLGTAGLLANSGYATGVTINGVNTLNISNQASLLGLGALPSGFQGNITGLTTVNDGYNGIGSVAGVQLGNVNQGLNTALKTVNINQFAGSPLVTGLGLLPVFSADIAQSASSATNALAVNLNGNLGFTKGTIPLTTGGAAIISIANANSGQGTAGAPNLSYGTQTYNTGTNTATYLQLEAQPQGFLAALVGASVDGTTSFVFQGAGTLAVGQDFAGDHQLAQDINASGTTGNVYITGATAGLGVSLGFLGAGSAYSSAANPGALYGSAAGFLDNTGTGGAFGLKSYELGSGTNFLDVSSASVAQIKALTTTPGALVALNNEIVVNDSVATTTSASTFAGIAGFEILGIGGATAANGAGGTINLANLTPSGLTSFDYVTAAKGDVFFTNQTVALTVNTQDNGGNWAITVGTATSSAPGLNDSFTLNLGNALHNTALYTGAGDTWVGIGGAAGGIGNGAGVVDNVTLFGDEIVKFNATGQTTAGPTIADNIDTVFLTPTGIGNEQVTISGDSNVIFGTDSGTGSILSETAGVLNFQNLAITDNNTAIVQLNDATVPGLPDLLHFANGGGFDGFFFVPAGPVIGYSTNAASIDATNSGGLWMVGGDANFNPVNSNGDTILGATNPVGSVVAGGTVVVGDILIGSIGNDTITSNSVSIGDTILTDGGKDTITLANGHTGVDQIGFYAGQGLSADGTVIGIAKSITGVFGGAEFATTGWFGVGAGGSGHYMFTFANGTGIATDVSTVANFNTSTDVLDFSVQAWANAGGVIGLSQQNFGFIGQTAAGAVSIQHVNPNDALAVGTNVIELSGNTGFLDVGAVASALATNTNYNIFHTSLGGKAADFLLAWQDSTGNTHISDLNLSGGTHTGFSPGSDHVVVSDIVVLTGVHLANLTATDLHLVA